MLKQIAALLARSPFEGFSILTTDGREYRIEQLEAAAIVADRVVVTLPGEGAVTLSRLHIAAINDYSRSQQA